MPVNEQQSYKKKKKSRSRSHFVSANYSDSDQNDNKKIKKPTVQKAKKKILNKYKLNNIYKSSNLEVLSGGQVRFKIGRDNNYDEVKVDNSIVPRLKPEFQALGRHMQPIGVTQAHYKSPDEVLTDEYKFEPNELVYLSRDEIKEYTKVELPDADITNAIHYYVADRIKTNLGISDEEYDKNYSQFLDGSALLALGALVSKWTTDCAGESTFRTYMEKIGRNSSQDANSIDEFVRIYANDDEDEEENGDSDDGEDANENSSGRKKSSTSMDFESDSNSDDDSTSFKEPKRVGRFRSR